MKTATEVTDDIVKAINDADEKANGIQMCAVETAAEEFIQTAVERAIEDSFRLGFEHAVAGGEEAGRYMQRAKLPLVMYFDNEEDRREMIDAVQAAHPSWGSVKIPERKK